MREESKKNNDPAKLRNQIENSLKWEENNETATGKPGSKWTKKEYEAFQCLFHKMHPQNPFIDDSVWCGNGTCLFVSHKKITYRQVKDLLKLLTTFDRYVHVNTGTYGMEDGETFFWKR